jgi:flagellar biogenesis protein FliO
MDISIILIIVVLAVYLVWKLMGTRNKKKHEQRRFNIRKHRNKKTEENDEDE